MNFNNELYKQWKTKLKNNQQFFVEKFDLQFPSSNVLETNKILLSTTITETEIDNFSLRLSNSYANETQKENQLNNIVINDSGSTESIFYCNKSTNSTYEKKIQNQIQKNSNILHSSSNESRISSINTINKITKNIDGKSKIWTEQYKKNKFIIEKNNSEIELTKLPQIVKESVTENITLSECKKKQILQWLSNNFDCFNYKCSYSQESIISKSGKSDISSGDSSLERLELNFETPNNREKFFKSKNMIQEKSDKQTTLDKYFIKLKKAPLNIINDSIYINTNDKIPISNIKINSRRKTQELKFFDSNIFIDNNYNQTSINEIKPHLKEMVTTKSNYLDYKISKIKNTKIKETILKPESSNSKTVPNHTIINCTINDYADILENLYGKTWKSKANTLISTTKSKEQKKKILKDLQIQKSITSKQPRCNSKSDDCLSNNEKKNCIQNSIKCSETSKKSTKTELKDNCINDDSIIKSSLNCSYYTAFPNSIATQNKQLKIVNSSTIEENDKSTMALSIYDSYSDSDNRHWKNRNNQRKLSFYSTSSSTSEFDPEDRVIPKSVLKNRIKDFSNSLFIKPKVIKQMNEQNAKKSFLASLSKSVSHENAESKAIIYRIKYNIMKEELCKDLYKLFNEQVFDNKLPNDMLIEWSTRLRGTAGKCYNKQSLKSFKKTIRSSRIVLATKILDSPDRLRDTLIHEMCHSATWLINNVLDGHGYFWKAWANKAMKVFPELPPISRCHNYEIQTKYVYKCINCGYSIGRHSKSLDLTKKRCGYCHGVFELLINKITKSGKIQKKSTFQTKQLSGFALYVKENYQSVKQSKIAMKHGEVMKILSRQFSAIKITQESEEH